MKKNFCPQLSPQEMLELGVFGGWYFKGDIDEYPKTWFEKAKISKDGFNKKLNYFEAKPVFALVYRRYLLNKSLCPHVSKTS